MRLSGNKALEIALKTTKRKTLTPRYATLSKIYDADDELIDEGLIIYFQAPKSFTGEDVVEFQCHGGIAIANMLLKTLLFYGARLAEPGEFSKRAFLNSKIDLSQAEAIAKLIESKSEEGVKLLSRQMRGELKDFVENIREKLLEILAYVEVNIDYAEEDLPDDIMEQIKEKLLEIAQKLKQSYESSLRRDGLLHGFHIAIVGKPNVGKSSLLNALLNDQRAIISDTAGTTRDLIEEELKLGTHLVKIIDTAGIRQTSDEIEQIGVERAKKVISQSNIVIALFDGSRIKDKEDEEIENLLLEHKNDKKIFTVVNKADLKQLYKPLPQDHITLSCKNSIETLVDLLKNYLDEQSIDESVMLSSARQLDAVKQALKAISRSQNLISEGELELFAYEIKEALENISSITKLYENDEMLDKMFSSFCLGK